jgi:hypothetical protein
MSFPIGCRVKIIICVIMKGVWAFRRVNVLECILTKPIVGSALSRSHPTRREK